MKLRHLLATAGLFFGFAGTMSACSSAQSACQAICDCEHCSDPKEDFTCVEFEAQEAIAEAYECSDQWEAYMDCFLDKGTCNERQVSYSTRSNTTCSDFQDSGVNCTSTADCQGIGFGTGVSCTGGSCQTRVCADSNTECSSDEDCLGEGQEQCQDEEDAVSECINNATGGAPPRL